MWETEGNEPSPPKIRQSLDCLIFYPLRKPLIVCRGRIQRAVGVEAVEFLRRSEERSERKFGHRKIKSYIEAIRLSLIAIFMFVFTFDLLCDIMMVNIGNEVFI